jgi:hypothetical protein
MPASAAAACLAASLGARAIDAEARGRVALARLPDDPEELAAAAARAFAAAGELATVLAVAQRTDGVDVLLGAQDAILVVLGAEADPALAALTLAGASELTVSAAAITLALDPVQRALALAGGRSPRAIRHAIEGLIA